MELISTNVGLPKEVEWQGGLVSTGIFKSPVEGAVSVSTLNLAGDGQADLRVHGGVHKAVYSYPFEHYAYWEEELGRKLSIGMFGENLTTSGLLETEAEIGNRYRIGSVLLEVSQPRMPCFKLGIRFGTPEIIRLFLQANRPGIYFRVIETGTLTAGDEVTLEKASQSGLHVVAVAQLYHDRNPEMELLERAIGTQTLPESWIDHFKSKREQLLSAGA